MLDQLDSLYLSSMMKEQFKSAIRNVEKKSVPSIGGNSFGISYILSSSQALGQNTKLKN